MRTAFILVFTLAAAVLIWRDGYDRGQQVSPCPEQNGKAVAYSVLTLNGELQCHYITHRRGLI